MSAPNWLFCYADCMLRPLLVAVLGLSAATAVTFSVSPRQWARNVPVVTVPSADGFTNAIVDTGGFTESKAHHPRDFVTYYHGLPISMAIGPDYLRDRSVTLGTPSKATPETIPLDVITKNRDTFALLGCTIDDRSYRMLLDTAALAWRDSDAVRRSPAGVILLSEPSFTSIFRRHPRWATHDHQIAKDDGFVEARAMVVPQTFCGGAMRKNRLIVERSDATTFNYLAKSFGVTVQGDASLSAFSGKSIRLDFPNRTLQVWP